MARRALLKNPWRDVENVRLTQIIKELQRHRFGRRAESLPEDQLLLGVEEAEQIEAAGEEEFERADPDTRGERNAKRRANRGALPPHLPRIEMVVAGARSWPRQDQDRAALGLRPR